ncbi:MAG TPA: alpha-xylosidase [Tepidisphaeraceae bacterium]|nr:alpha-xylosidase [Tepidisphaeraceae bacterium]
MKFSDGAWLWAKGVTPACMRRVCLHRIEADSLWLAAIDRAGMEHMDRVEGVALEMRISSPMPDCLRVQIRHHHPAEIGVRKFDLDYSLAAPKVKIDDAQDELRFTSGNLSLRINKSTMDMHFENQGACITQARRGSLGYMTVADHGGFIMQRLGLSVGECIYGMGERFGPLVKNGQTVVIRNEDGGTVSDQAYKNVPFYLSSNGYGLLVNTPGKVEFEVGTELVSQMQFSVNEEHLDYYIFAGPEPKDILEKYTRLAGRPALPPAWSYGLWLSTSFTTHYNEKTVNEFVDGMASRDIPLSVFHFDCFWMKERQWCDFEWDRQAFPDAEGMLRRLKAKGLKICLWINPYIFQCSTIFAEGRERGYFLKTKAGDVYQRDQWQPGIALVDFTNHAAVDWYQSKLQKLLDMGVDCFKTDFAERIPDDAVYHDGSDPRLMHNYYTYLYNKCVFELLERHHGKGNALVFARSATVGGQKFPVHWGGDCVATFESMAEDLRGGLSFCSSGFSFWSHDMGGFTGTADPALYKRWCAFGLLSTHSRLHGSNSYRVPWLFDEESVEVVRKFAKLKNRLFPYIFSTSFDAHERGWPAMRTMFVEFPDDPACRYLDRQYMLGPSLLVAPIFRHDDVAEYYVPAGKWTHLLTGKTIEGGHWRNEKFGFLDMPLFVRPNTMLPMSANEQQPRWRFGDELSLHLFQIADGADLSVRLADSGSEGITQIHCQRNGGTFMLSSDGRIKNMRVIANNVGHLSRITNGKLISESSIEWIDSRKPLTFNVDEK